MPEAKQQWLGAHLNANMMGGGGGGSRGGSWGGGGGGGRPRKSGFTRGGRKSGLKCDMVLGQAFMDMET